MSKLTRMSGKEAVSILKIFGFRINIYDFTYFYQKKTFNS